MTHERKDLIIRLARAACRNDGVDPDNFPEGTLTGPYGAAGPWYTADEHQKPWHRYVAKAAEFLAFYEAMAARS
jgi:hypothetical protein